MDEVIKPSAQFMISRQSGLSVTNYLNLSQYYLPIIGRDAFALYHFLDSQTENELKSHSEILTWLDFGMPTLIKAREKLEALGLLKSFFNTTKQVYRYEILAPLSTERFFADEILCSLLQVKIGDKAFAALKKVSPTAVNAQEKEISATFQSIYALSEMTFNQGETASEAVTVEKTTLDWLFLNDLLEKQGRHLKMLTAPERQELRQLAELYGYDELTLAKVILQSSPEGIDIKAVKKSIATDFNSALQGMADKNVVPADEDRFARLQTQGFSQAELAFIRATEQFAPLPFLAGIKRQKKGFVADSERYLIENLRKRSNLPDAVINVLIDYVLRQQNQPVLQAGYVNTIANDWAQRGIKLPEEAMLAIQTLIKEAQNKPARKKYGSANAREAEPLPDWVDKEFKETEMSAAEQAKIKERIKKLNESR